MARDSLTETVYDVKFVALVPTESVGQLAWDGGPEEALEALENYLTQLYGPRKFKIIQFREADDIGDQIIHIPPMPIHSKEEH